MCGRTAGTCDCVGDYGGPPRPQLRMCRLPCPHLRLTRLQQQPPPQGLLPRVPTVCVWGQGKTLGCTFDQLFYDNADGDINRTTVVHLGSKSTRKNIGGTFCIGSYDVFGKSATTTPEPTSELN